MARGGMGRLMQAEMWLVGGVLLAGLESIFDSLRLDPSNLKLRRLGPHIEQ
jgi:hypothetical protein